MSLSLQNKEIIIKTITNQLLKKIPTDFLTKSSNRTAVVHHQALKVEYLLESIHVECSNSNHA